MRKLLTLGLTAAMLCIVSTAKAGGHNDAGCGIGAYIFQDNTKGQQLLAMTTNAWFGQLYSITTGTSGCAPDKVAYRREQRKIFVKVNFRDLSRELAAGEGEYALSFASLMGCGEAAPSFLDYTKKNYGEIFSTEGTTPEQVLNSLEGRVAGDKGLSQVCTL